MKTLYFDCFSGAAGDMIVGALIDVGADGAAVCAALDGLGLAGMSVSVEQTVKSGIQGTRFHVAVDPDTPQPHRHLRHILEILETSGLSTGVKEASAATFRRIAECEAEVHGTPPEKVHFHEVGAIDSIADIVGVHVALELLGVDQICASPLHIGSGTVKCAHGVLPVPAPATALLLQGVPCYGGEVQAELVTPTGAAVITQLAESYGPVPDMRIEAIGYGCGTRDLPDRPNVLRVFLGEREDACAAAPVTVIETNIDDMPAELLATLVQDALDAGARDAFLTPITCKKGRPGHLITVLCDEAKAPAITDVLFAASTTFGIRMRREHRICLAREWKPVETPWGDVRVKIGTRHGRTTAASPEFEDCCRIAHEAGVSTRAVYETALAKALRGEWKA